MPRLERAEDYKRADTKTIVEKAREIILQEQERCTVFDSKAQDEVPVFDAQEIVTGRVVGRGGFCVVREITAIKLVGSEKLRRRRLASRTLSNLTTVSSRSNVSEVSSREYLARRVWSNSGKFVIKQVEPSLLENDRVCFLKGIIDLALEARYLASLSHPHILALRGLSREHSSDDPGYFLILDQLKEILPQRLNAWMQAKRTTKGVTGFITRGKRKVTSLLVQRLLVTHDIADAMDYLHGRRIIYRDLKPDNIGFDGEDILKVYDFGLAKQLNEDELVGDGLYQMTGMTGAIRYMAPEVGLRKPYNLSADVYSWSMLMWYIMALEPPMGLFTPNMFIDRVFKKGCRPAVKSKWSPGLCNLMKSCWSKDISERPAFKSILLTLRAEATALDPELSHFLAGDAASRISEGVQSSTGAPSGSVKNGVAD